MVVLDVADLLQNLLLQFSQLHAQCILAVFEAINLLLEGLVLFLLAQTVLRCCTAQLTDLA